MDHADPALIAQAARARDGAIRRLLDGRRESVAWDGPIDLNALNGAVFVIMLRATGLIEAEALRHDEVRIVRHLVTEVNADGGFCRYRGGPSSRSATRLAILALRLCLGEPAAVDRPPWRLARNALVDTELAGRMRATVERAQEYLAPGPSLGRLRGRDSALPFLEGFIRAYAGGWTLAPVLRLAVPRLLAHAARTQPSRFRFGQISVMIRSMAPACAILASRLPGTRRPSRTAAADQPDPAERRKRAARIMARAAATVRAEQNENGAWVYSPLLTMLNIMALREAGAPLDDAVIVKAVAYLRASMSPAGDGGSLLTFLSNDVWCTAAAAWVCLDAQDAHTSGEALQPALEWLLHAQHADGGFAFASRSQNHVDHDSTGMALLALATARRRGMRLAGLDAAIDHASLFLQSRQNPDGGFAAYARGVIRARPGPQKLFKAALFDVASADVTGRVLTGLGRAGLTAAEDCVRRALRFLCRTQCRNGGWWGRWWAGYVAATGAVLYAFGEVGFRAGDAPAEPATVHASMMRGIEFLWRCQHEDGGWGETNEADRDEHLAGIGPSTPLHTAYALVGLLRCGVRRDTPPVERAVAYLLRTMTPDGRWLNEDTMFTVFPGTLYYTHPLVGAILVPMALNHYLDARAAPGRPVTS